MTNRTMISNHLIIFLAFALYGSQAFILSPVGRTESVTRLDASAASATSATTKQLLETKERLLGLVQAQPQEDLVLADPFTKEGVTVKATSTVLAGVPSARVKYVLQSPSNSFQGSSDTFLNLLEPVKSEIVTKEEERSQRLNTLVRNALPLIPPPLRSALATFGVPMGRDFVPMRDLFTSPSVSFAYERGWRQNFAQAGFPGPDREAEMAMDFFAAPMASPRSTGVVVDMSCATGLFTRRFAKSGKYKRVLGCDYSESMLSEARRRIQRDPALANLASTRLDLVRLDVGLIPMKINSVDALHAGAAMHCWPDLPAAAAEIYRVLKPGGRYFATTFLSSYFGVLQAAEGGQTGPSRQAFQYFRSLDDLRALMVGGGFDPDKIQIEIIQPMCVVIRCEK